MIREIYVPNLFYAAVALIAKGLLFHDIAAAADSAPIAQFSFINSQTSSSAVSSMPVVVAQVSGPKPEATKPAAAVDSALETRFWNDIRKTDSAADFRLYLDAFPDGQYAAQARKRLQELEQKTVAATASDADPNKIRDCPRCPPLVEIPPGVFAMGSSEMFQGPVHEVKIPQAFYIGQREVTLDEWDACVTEGGCEYSPASIKAAQRSLPVTNLDWNDTQQYLTWLSKKTGKNYRLPSESEWEYAARAGTSSLYPWGPNMEKNRGNCADCNGAASNSVVAAGSYPPNKFGLYDMMGNAAEWVEDCWYDTYKSAPTDGSARTNPHCQEHVLRGGAFNNDARYLRSASRFKYDFDVRYYTNGFRVVRAIH